MGSENQFTTHPVTNIAVTHTFLYSQVLTEPVI